MFITKFWKKRRPKSQARRATIEISHGDMALYGDTQGAHIRFYVSAKDDDEEIEERLVIEMTSQEAWCFMNELQYDLQRQHDDRMNRGSPGTKPDEA
jgi:hypothetical protein